MVTTSLPVANLFASEPNSDLVLIGGNVCPRTGVVRGPYADQMLSHVRVRKTVLSAAAVCEEGFFNNNLLLIETERAMMRAGKEVIVVVDSTEVRQPEPGPRLRAGHGGPRGRRFADSTSNGGTSWPPPAYTC